jgi:hypothetical protein
VWCANQTCQHDDQGAETAICSEIKHGNRSLLFLCSTEADTLELLVASPELQHSRCNANGNAKGKEPRKRCENISKSENTRAKSERS